MVVAGQGAGGTGGEPQGVWERCATKLGISAGQLGTLSALTSALGFLSGLAQFVGPFVHSPIAVILVTLMVAAALIAFALLIFVGFNRRHVLKKHLPATIGSALAVLFAAGAVGWAIGFFAHGGGSPQTAGHAETTGSTANTWSDFTDAGGTHGAELSANQTVAIACKVQGYKVQDGDTWWYKIASSPWDGNFYVSADAFYNNGQPAGTLAGTALVDTAVPNC